MMSKALYSSSSAHKNAPAAAENLSPKEFVKKYPLPRVAYIYNAENEMDGDDNNTCLDLQQPFLLYKSYTSMKVHARSLDNEGVGGLKEVGPTVAIPEDYTGWFSLVSDDGRSQTKSYSSVEQVANAHVPVFLVRNDTPAFKMQDIQAAGGKIIYTKTTVKTGHVLKLLGIYEDIYSRNNRYSSISKSQEVTSSKSHKYAQCLNYKGEVLYLPFTAKGLFYPTGNAKSISRNKECVFLMSHLLKFIEFPVSVRLVCGFLPKVPFNFTGLLRLSCAKQEEIILACTLLKERNVMLEMDMKSSFALCMVSDRERIVKSEVCQSALSFCSDEAEIWKRQMKVMHFIYPSSSPTNSPTPTEPERISKRLSSASQQRLQAEDPTTKLETQSMCISMIFDDMDEDESKLLEAKVTPKLSHGVNNQKKPQPMTVVAKTATKPEPINTNTPSATVAERNSRPTRFWTLKHLRKLINFGSDEVMRGINDWVNDGSKNANDEFITRDYMSKPTPLKDESSASKASKDERTKFFESSIDVPKVLVDEASS